MFGGFYSCAEESKQSSPETVSLDRLAGEINPWLVSGNLDFQRIPDICRTAEGGSLCLNYTNTVVHAAHLLSFWDPGILVIVSRRCPGDLPPIKIPGKG